MTAPDTSDRFATSRSSGPARARDRLRQDPSAALARWRCPTPAHRIGSAAFRQLFLCAPLSAIRALPSRSSHDRLRSAHRHPSGGVLCPRTRSPGRSSRFAAGGWARIAGRSVRGPSACCDPVGLDAEGLDQERCGDRRRHPGGKLDHAIAPGPILTGRVLGSVRAMRPGEMRSAPHWLRSSRLEGLSP